nr:hypothetical protein [uncultured Flavobacterium sp.]
MKQFIIISFLFFFYKSFAQEFEKGNISPTNKITLINELNSISDKTIDGTKTIIINFYIEKDLNPENLCIDHYVNDKKYKKFIKKNKLINQFFITEQNYNYDKKYVIEDKNNTIKNLLFENAEWCGNYIIIKPDGSFIRKYGEYIQDDIPHLLK